MLNTRLFREFTNHSLRACVELWYQFSNVASEVKGCRLVRSLHITVPCRYVYEVSHRLGSPEQAIWKIPISSLRKSRQSESTTY